MKRNTKFYRKNEAEVMKSFGLKPTKNSGSGWIEKEDGQNEFVICQLKSTDAQSIKVNQKDLRILEYNAMISHKIPMFVIQFLNTGECWLMCKPVDMQSLSEFLETGETSIEQCITVEDIKPEGPKKVISSSYDARNSFNEERKQKYNKTRSAK